MSYNSKRGRKKNRKKLVRKGNKITKKSLGNQSKDREKMHELTNVDKINTTKYL